ncbi:hypothetical protein GCM10009733_092000 [Nonomuraea maheshkhaliensis]|uniref:DUF3558 domain-containing protein n=1 Tax=Nonomuraea maheshkhaliensis TaxID=419590 RepID=A0ABP4T1Q3_9ACTN
MSSSPQGPLVASILALVLIGGGGATACALLPPQARGGDDGARTEATVPEERRKERAAVEPASFKGEDLCSIFPSGLLKRLVRDAQENPADDTSTMSSAESTCAWESGEQPRGRVEQKRDLKVTVTMPTYFRTVSAGSAFAHVLSPGGEGQDEHPQHRPRRPALGGVRLEQRLRARRQRRDRVRHGEPAGARHDHEAGRRRGARRVRAEEAGRRGRVE